MNQKPNPFSLRELSPDAPFCNREAEMHALSRHASSGVSVVLYGPRRYGKTSLVRRVQDRFMEQGGAALFSDFFGVTSSDDVARRLATALYRFTSPRETLMKKAIRMMRTFRPVFRPDESGSVMITVEPAGKTIQGLELLEQTLESLGSVVKDFSGPVNLALHEFQEITELPDGFQIEALMRKFIQRLSCSFFFIGSRRRILLDMFENQNRPFYQSALHMELKALPEPDLILFIQERFQAGSVRCGPDQARAMASLTGGHPYLAQKLCYLVFENCHGAVQDEHVTASVQELMEMDRPLYEAQLQGLAPRQIALLRGLAVEPTTAVFSLPYMQRHELGSTGAVQGGLKRLTALDLVEQDLQTGAWRVTDPMFAMWLAKM
ncbi:ATP-binding protein [Desulfonatronospira sp.]|uniref:AAA family ATPase n=1 Tax=Desulfonatronospira sp. TaxID=1962951 RepID=UPI0025B7EF29|nr:ATP-binding protein [Desulfonatronospira sp.]